MSTACGSERPDRCSSSSTSSKVAESLKSLAVTGKIRSSPSSAPSPPDPPPGASNSSVWSFASRARIRFRLPLMVLISPLCAMTRNGWASGQLGKVLVENRLCTSAIADA
jgi:hypothetical protein